jgi:hypothetical protein
MAMNAVFAPDREPVGGKSRPGPEPNPPDERILAAPPQPFRIQFVGAAPGRGLTILSEVEIEASDVSSVIIWAMSSRRPTAT